ncbi:MAG: flagellar assembly peptidoglycan hydrolase FlgJ [Plesiomonas sp.]|uniref:flagellar assembly peptidoglycan hydrolase FlgJ n=1 Tax=Plesiomonas sp. TaxID=2486279 RepID=UPI003F399794
MDTPFVDASTYHDLSSLSRLREAAQGDDNNALRAAANQFEATFMRQMLKSMRDANAAFKSDSPFNSSSGDFYQQMYDEELAGELSRQGSLGLADLLVKQLGGEDEQTASASSVAQAGGQPISSLQTSLPLTAPLASNALNPLPARGSLQNMRAPLGDLLSELRLRKTHVGDAKPLGDDQDTHKLLPELYQPESLQHAQRAKTQDNQGRGDTENGTFSSAQEFVATLFPHALKAAKRLGTTPAILIAQAALETGWGKSIIQNAAGSSNNLFNIKADKRWQGDKVTVRTLEYFDGTAVNMTSPFRAYESFADSFDDYVHFLQQNGRYSKALQQAANPETYISHLQQAGYATDPRYASKVISILRRVQSLLE